MFPIQPCSAGCQARNPIVFKPFIGHILTGRLRETSNSYVCFCVINCQYISNLLTHISTKTIAAEQKCTQFKMTLYSQDTAIREGNRDRNMNSKVNYSVVSSSKWRIYYHSLWVQLLTTCCNAIEESQYEQLLAAVGYNQLRTMASKTRSNSLAVAIHPLYGSANRCSLSRKSTP